MGELAPDYDHVLRDRFGERLGSTLADAVRRLQAHGEAGKAAIEAKLRAYLTENGCAPAARPPTSAAASKRSPPALPASKPA